MATRAFLFAQARADLQKYGLIGFLRDNGSAVAKKIAQSESTINFSTCVLVNVKRTESVAYNVAVDDVRKLTITNVK